MSFENAVLKNYSFDQTVFVRFLGRKDFSLARYHTISIEGFSCYCSKSLTAGEINRVEVNLKMVTNGMIDDTVPHIANAKLYKISHEDGKQICWFKYVDFKNSCFDNLINALMFIESKETAVALPVISDTGDMDSIINEIVKKSKDGHFILPVLPKIVREIDILFKQSDATIEDLAMLIEKDAAISVKVLATANSPFYRADSDILTIRDTIPRLGFKATRNLILTIANKSFYSVKNIYFKPYLQELWKHSLVSAHCAKAIAECKGFKNPDNYYTAGLIHDIGKTVILRFLSEMKIEDRKFDDQLIVSGIEKYNAVMSDIVLRHWEFPGRFINAVTMKYDDDVNDSANKVKLIISVANMLSGNMGYDLMDDLVDLEGSESVKLLGMDLNTLNKIIENVNMLMENSESAF